MDKFQREDRYIVIKRSDLAKVPTAYRAALVEPLMQLKANLPCRASLVIESDWPEFEIAYQMIEARMTGQPTALEAALAHEAALREEIKCLKAVLNGMEFQQVDEMVSDGIDACIFLGQESARIIKGIQSERDALREELSQYEPASPGTASKRARWLLNIQDACKYGLPKHLVQRLNNTTKEIQNSIKYGGTKRLRDENESLQQRLTIAEQRAGELEIALINVRETLGREYWDQYAGLDETRDILDAALKPAAEGEGS